MHVILIIQNLGVLRLLVEAMKGICAAERDAHAKVRAAQRSAQEAFESAKQAGDEALERTLIRAKSEIAHLIRASDKKATEDARELASKTANKQAALHARAERRLDAAAQLIVERIVKL